MTMLRGKHVAVTGGGGFLGQRVVEQLRSSGVDDVTVVRKRDVDLTDQAATARWFREHAPEVVVHLAAEVGGIGANQDQPGRFFYANMAMGLNVVEGCRLIGVYKLVVVSTVCAYPENTPIPFREDDLWAGYPERTNAPYGIAKRSLLTMLSAYHDQYGLDAVYLLPANLYGPGDDFDLKTSHVIPALIRKFIEARDRRLDSVPVWGTGQASREFLYVDDAARAVVLAAERLETCEPLNIGSGTETTIAELANSIATLVGFDGRLAWDHSRPDGQPRRSLDVSRARSLLGFEATTPLLDGLAATIEWYERRRTRTGQSDDSLST